MMIKGSTEQEILGEVLMARALERLHLQVKVCNPDYPHKDAKCCFYEEGVPYIAVCSWIVYEKDGDIDYTLEVSQLVETRKKGKKKEIVQKMILSRQFTGEIPVKE